jgi:hypothetical protein
VIVGEGRYYHSLTDGFSGVVLDTIKNLRFRFGNRDSRHFEILSKKVFGEKKIVIVSLLITINTTNTNNNPIRAYACV